MSLDWIPRDDELKDHYLWRETDFFHKEAPGVVYERRPLEDDKGKTVDKLYVAWIILNNPAQYNSYTTEMVKGVIAGFQRASADSSVVAAIFTGNGTKAFCTGGNTKEYAEYYSMRPDQYGLYMDLFNAMVDSILNCKKPTLCRVNGMRVAGGQEIGMACDVSVAADTAIFGQAGPRHGSAPDGGSTDFLPWYLSAEDAMWNCISCELWSAYKMKRLGLIRDAVPVVKGENGYIRNPLVITDRYVDNGDIVYGEMKTGPAADEAKKMMKDAQIDLAPLDKAVQKIVWTFANLMPGCLIKSIDGIRAKKKFFWDTAKLGNRHWLAANMSTEAYLGFNAFNNRKMTGQDVIDFIKYRQLLAEGHPVDQKLFEAVLPAPKKS